MKIPVYRKQIDYRRTAARDVALAQPLPEAAGSGGLWLDMAQMLGSATAGAGRIMVRKKKEWEREVARQKQTSPESRPPKKAKKTAFGKEFSETTEEPSSGAAQFSSENRGRMLSYCRTEAFEPNDAEHQTAPEKLDAYFMRLRSAAQETGGEDLLAQDYVVMRKEVERLSAVQNAREQTRRFNQGAGNFVQTAAMVRTPRALEEYISANLSAAKEETSSSEAGWAVREKALRSAAVRHNIEAALGAGEAEQAGAVLTHFEKNFSERECKTLRQKVAFFRADEAAQRCEGEAYAACRDQDGQTDEKKLLSWTKENGGKTGVASQDLFRALQVRFAAAEREELRRRAEEYGRLAAGAEEEHAAALAASSVSDEKEYDRLCRAVQGLCQHPQPQSERSAYNGLYERVVSGAAAEKELDGAFEKGSLSARDYLRLKSDSCRWRAGDGEAQERLLMCAAADLCRGRTEKEAEEIKYFIFSSPGGAEAKIQAAAQAKRILNLQEKKA